MTLAGIMQGGGASIGSEKNTLVYEMPINKITSVTLGAVAFEKGSTAREESSAAYAYSGVSAIDTSDFAVTMESPENVSAGESMTLLAANTTLADIASTDTIQSEYSYTPVSGWAGERKGFSGSLSVSYLF